MSMSDPTVDPRALASLPSITLKTPEMRSRSSTVMTGRVDPLRCVKTVSPASDQASAQVVAALAAVVDSAREAATADVEATVAAVAAAMVAVATAALAAAVEVEAEAEAEVAVSMLELPLLLRTHSRTTRLLAAIPARPSTSVT